MAIRSSTVIKSRTRNDFWKFWTGQTISTLESSFTSFALPLLIFNLTGSSLNLASTVTVIVLPYLLFGLVVGAWVDRMNRKRLMVATDLARALVIASISLVSFVGLISVWWIYAVAFLNSALAICFDAANFAAIPQPGLFGRPGEGQWAGAGRLLNSEGRRPAAGRSVHYRGFAPNVAAN